MLFCVFICIIDSVISTDISSSTLTTATVTATVKMTTVTATQSKKTTTSRRSGATDSPMLNYIFDSHSHSKHQHYHDHRWGPHFEGKSTNVTAQAGATVTLDCRISLLQDKTVSLLVYIFQ